MTTMELNAKLLRELSYIALNEEMLEKTLKYIKRLRKENKAELKPYTIEELHARLDESEAEFAAGEGVGSEEVHRRMNQFINQL